MAKNLLLNVVIIYSKILHVLSIFYNNKSNITLLCILGQVNKACSTLVLWIFIYIEINLS